MAQPTAQQAHALITYFKDAYENTQGKSLVLNRNKVQYAFKNILIDFSPVEARDLIDFYMTYPSPNINWFIYNYDEVVRDLEEDKKNREVLARRRQQTSERLKEWRARWKN